MYGMRYSNERQERTDEWSELAYGHHRVEPSRIPMPLKIPGPLAARCGGCDNYDQLPRPLPISVHLIERNVICLAITTRK